MGTAPPRVPVSLVGEGTDLERGSGLLKLQCWVAVELVPKRHTLLGTAGMWGKCRKHINGMNCTHLFIYCISMGHMVMAHLSLLPWGPTQSQSQNGHFNTKHIRKGVG